MPDSNWRHHPATRGIAIAVGVVAIAIIIALAAQKNEQGEQQYATQNQSNRFWSPSPFGKQIDPNSGVYQSSCKHPTNQGDADLCQQWRAAEAAEKAAANTDPWTYWNLIQFGVAIATAIFTGLAAWAAARSVRVASAVVGNLERPHLYAKVINPNMLFWLDPVIFSRNFFQAGGNDPRVSVQFANAGRSPAFLKRPFAQMFVIENGTLDSAVPNWEYSPVFYPEARGVLPPNEMTEAIDAVLIPKYTEATLNQILAQERSVWLGASCLYADTAGNHRMMKASFRLYARHHRFDLEKYSDEPHDDQLPGMFS